MDLLLDINVAVDSCVGREPWCAMADLAMAKCSAEGGRFVDLYRKRTDPGICHPERA